MGIISRYHEIKRVYDEIRRGYEVTRLQALRYARYRISQRDKPRLAPGVSPTDQYYEFKGLAPYISRGECNDIY